MIQINGKYAEAKVMCLGDSDVDQYAISQIQMIADNEATKGSSICVMPDVHPGKVGPIGLTMTITDTVIPALIGVDIGCGMSMARLGKIRKDFKKLDTVIRDNVPVGAGIRNKPHVLSQDFDFDRLICAKHIRKDKVLLGLGTLGGGNHFIEVDEDEDGEGYLIIHSGSRHLGKEVADHYVMAGSKLLKNLGKEVPHELTYLTGSLFTDYLHDLKVAQEYAEFNRMIMIKEICKGMKWKAKDIQSCIHNYIDQDGDRTILRKGAISAKDGEDVIIPINMRDGVILGKGKGNPTWNYSAPHGAGRLFSRGEAAGSHTVNEFKAAMKGIYTSCINKDTLDEAPFAYRNVDYIKEAVEESVSITKLLKPVYNYKGGNA